MPSIRKRSDDRQERGGFYAALRDAKTALGSEKGKTERKRENEKRLCRYCTTPRRFWLIKLKRVADIDRCTPIRKYNWQSSTDFMKRKDVAANASLEHCVGTRATRSCLPRPYLQKTHVFSYQYSIQVYGTTKLKRQLPAMRCWSFPPPLPKPTSSRISSDHSPVYSYIPAK